MTAAEVDYVVPRVTCPVCREVVAQRKDRLPMIHGPWLDRCPGSDPPDTGLEPSKWDRLTGRLAEPNPSVDDRMRNAAAVCAAARAAAHPDGDTLDDEEFLWQARRTTEPWLRGAP